MNDTSLRACRICTTPVRVLADFGPQALSNRFQERPAQSEFLHPFAVGQCPSCAVVQLLNPPPAEALRPRFDWLAYNEPEAHLDALADRLVALAAAQGTNPLIGGASYKDDTLLRRLEKLGLRRTWRLDPSRDLGVTAPAAGVETVQALGPEAASDIAARHGRSDLLVARHVFEHAANPGAFLAGLRDLLTPDGLLVLEVPEASRALRACGAAALWEEHTLYLTPTSFTRALESLGWQVVEFHRYPYALEDSLVAVARKVSTRNPGPSTADDAALGDAVVTATRRHQANHERFLARAARGGPVAVLGANHFAVTYLNLLGLAGRVAFVIDDHPRKQGLWMPGSGLPIVGSEALLNKGVALCLLAVNPASAEGVQQRHAEYVRRGGRFASVFDADPAASAARGGGGA